jgi:membrane-bound serine protease (ClpP class)
MIHVTVGGWRLLLGALLVVIGITVARPTGARAQDSREPVYVIEIHGTIDLGLAPYVSRVLREAGRADARAVILEIDTPGGRLDAVLQIQDAILDAPVRTIAFVDRTAFSAGALVAIAANEIYMAPGAVMGAATPVDAGGEPAGEKATSAVRSTFRSTAELRGRDPRVAEAMVDPAVAIDGLVDEGQLLTLTTTEARRVGYADGVAASRDELLAATGLQGAPVVETSPGLAETVVRFLTNPVVAGLLITLGFLLILLDFATAGLGLAGAAGGALLALFFWGHFIAGLAGWEGVALVVVGLALIAVEVFLMPGFGVAGLLGLAALGGGLFISLISDEIVTRAALVRAGYTVGLSGLATLAGAAVLLWYLPRLPWLRGLVLQTHVGALELEGGVRHPLLVATLEREPSDEPAARAVERRSYQGATGVALSDLRPGGYARIGEERVDVVTRGDYIPAGAPVEVVADEGYRRVVRRIATEASGTGAGPAGAAVGEG